MGSSSLSTDFRFCLMLPLLILFPHLVLSLLFNISHFVDFKLPAASVRAWSRISQLENPPRYAKQYG